MLCLRTPVDPGRWLYDLVAPVYDRMSGEGLLYAAARARAIDLLDLSPEDTVLDVACGTGRNHELIERRIGTVGRLVGVDRSPRMLGCAPSVPTVRWRVKRGCEPAPLDAHARFRFSNVGAR